MYIPNSAKCIGSSSVSYIATTPFCSEYPMANENSEINY